jgi:hypothetical protein
MPDKSARAEPALPPAFAKHIQTNGLAPDLKREAKKNDAETGLRGVKAQHTGKNLATNKHANRPATVGAALKQGTLKQNRIHPTKSKKGELIAHTRSKNQFFHCNLHKFTPDSRRSSFSLPHLIRS